MVPACSQVFPRARTFLGRMLAVDMMRNLQSKLTCMENVRRSALHMVVCFMFVLLSNSYAAEKPSSGLLVVDLI